MTALGHILRLGRLVGGDEADKDSQTFKEQMLIRKVPRHVKAHVTWYGAFSDTESDLSTRGSPKVASGLLTSVELLIGGADASDLGVLVAASMACCR